MKSPVFRLFLGLCLLLPRVLRADVQLPAIFSDHVVLMRAAAVPVWGRADPGEHVRVTIGGKTAEADADAAGRWNIFKKTACLTLLTGIRLHWKISVT